ncbi:AI-2E family transporter [Anaerotignum lactatifermentans]|uniref:AI-2E family transporter n=1 Tax=Anaerotignum lactatifermentans TaxID=160404 RepID=A0ABS2GA76_9FIRM|nr:AI-2E family transporter [Anaerotignum lactatifermentans]MBM6829889.1 AI-2E family transporter [Anaerotignum lactatifermentans]MBM6878391.1 AI-2E family transporter [Anaerotignum lactatifermentans]MBM6951546.1 AI-2E family transporter [Anaerotignum lactatifermentans]
MQLDDNTFKKLRWLIVFTLVVFILLWRMEMVALAFGLLLNISAPFLLGAAIAFILSVPMARIEKILSGMGGSSSAKKKLLRPLSLILTLLFVITILALSTLVVLPELGRTFSSLVRTIQLKFPVFLQQVEELFQNNPEISQWLHSVDLDWETLSQKALEFFQNGANVVVGSAFSAARGIFSGVANFVIGFVFACYILIQKEKLGLQCRKLLYAYLKAPLVERILEICSLTHRTFASFLTGQCLEAVILGTMFFVTMTIFRFPYALLVGVLIALTALIPIFGAFIGCFVATFLILVINPWQALAFLILFLILQQIEGNFIYPHVVGGSVGLPSIWVLVAVTIGGNLMGIAGMLLFIPMVSVLYTLLRRDVYARLKEKDLNVS